ncbi:helix-turn-helix transcriptional regulator [Chryseobacterium sp. ISL-6]|uniref:helix-turn-helix domain-containing protein n=1 Tax=Chryseobacterium sp. ISL-6 TaxID=2819143 RepID=UPI001BE7956A|nr:helix-turn-helix transcriptional regulator [Chryseobacterium sp. ISL-6]MBT2621898.1 helix-turn-helix transcriptional regulator [Chryseobacterium sp. ISL-6]
MLTLGTKLTRLRKKKGYSQQEVADLLQISQPAYHKWETDMTHPDLENLLRVSKIFEVDLSYLTEEGSNLISNNQFEGSNMVANHQHVINMHSPELLQTIVQNQQEISKLIEMQGLLINKLMTDK